MNKRILLLLCLVMWTAPLVAQRFDLKALIKQSDKRSSKDRAAELVLKGKPGEAIPFLEHWLRAVPADAEAAQMLAGCYASAGHPNDAKAAQELANANGIAERESVGKDYSLLFHKQVRWGRSRVLYPPDFKASEPNRLVVLLHGNGHTPEIMLSWARGLKLKNVIFVCPEAPYLKIKESFSAQREKFSAAGEALGMPDSSFASIVDLSAEWYESVCIDARRQLPVTDGKTIIVGFSQGGFFANVLATRFPDTFAALVSLSASMYPAGKVVERYDQLKASGIDVFLAHGTKDEVVPFQTAELMKAAMERAGVNVTYEPFDGGHWPTPELTEKIATFIREHLK
ncbi:hypothetical protein BH10BAC6_BH10BAC6_10750 [soil metagenome]